jgi:uncharacterized protein YbbK (DUF523 family)
MRSDLPRSIQMSLEDIDKTPLLSPDDEIDLGKRVRSGDENAIETLIQANLMMRNFPKPKIVASKCLEFEACRFNGQVISDAFVRSLRDTVEFITVCPEVEIGLGTPREPIRIIEIQGRKSLKQPATGRDVTAEMQNFSRQFLDSLPEVDGFILKSRSPSCGPKDVRVYSESGLPAKNSTGFFAQAARLSCEMGDGNHRMAAAAPFRRCADQRAVPAVGARAHFRRTGGRHIDDRPGQIRRAGRHF